MARRKVEQIEEVEIEEAIKVDDDSLLSAKEAATKIGTDARTLRKFLRSKFGLVGQGQRWAIDAEDIPKLQEQFEAWEKGKSRTKAEAAAPAEDDIDDDELEDALEEITDDDLEELEV